MNRKIQPLAIRRALDKAATAWPDDILDALSTPIAVLNGKGVIVSTNRAWKNCSKSHLILGAQCAAGENYIAACERGNGTVPPVPSAAQGLSRVLSGGLKEFKVEYVSSVGSEQEWFRLTATPISDEASGGAVVMHINITEQKRAELLQQEFSNLGQKLSSVATTKEAAWIMVDVSQKLIGWHAMVLDLYSPETDAVHPILTMDTIDDKLIEVPSVNPNYEPTQRTRRAIEQGGFLILREKTAPKPKNLVPFGDTTRLSASIIFVPVRNGARVTGVLSIQSYTHNAYDNSDLNILQALADHCSGALERIWAEEERKKAEAQLQQSNEQLRALASRMQSIKEEECFRIAREIHDELGQALTGFKFDLSWMERQLAQPSVAKSPGALREKVQSMVQSANHTIEAVRRISRELRPRVLDDLGLIAAIEWQAQEFEKRTGIRCEMCLEENTFTLAPEAATAVFRIFQEILTNVARHAHASKITVAIKKIGSCAVLKVKDNGRGISKSELAGKKSLGLLGMRERALFLGGEVEIEGEKKKGTTITVKIPLPAQERRETTDGHR